MPMGMSPLDIMGFLTSLLGVSAAQGQQEESTQANKGRYEQSLWLQDQMRNDAVNQIGGGALGLAPSQARYNPAYLSQFANTGQNSWGGNGLAGTPSNLIRQSGLPNAEKVAGDIDANNGGVFPGTLAPQGQIPGRDGVQGFVQNLLNGLGINTGQTKATPGQQGQAASYNNQLYGGGPKAGTPQKVSEGGVAARSTAPSRYAGGTFEGTGNPNTRYVTGGFVPGNPNLPSQQPYRLMSEPGNGGFNLFAAPASRPSDMATAYMGDSNNLIGGYDQRMATAMAMLEGMGSQARRDLSTQFKGATSQNLQQLASRGLGNSTIGSSIRTGAAEQEQAAANRLNEGLRQQQVNAFTDLSGDTLNAKNDQVAGLAGLRNLAFSTQQQQNQNALNTISGRTDTAPGVDQILGLSKQFADAAQQQRDLKAQKAAQGGGGFFNGGTGMAMGLGLQALTAPLAGPIPWVLAGAAGYGAGKVGEKQGW